MTELLDFIAPRYAGLAKYMITNKKKMSVNPTTGNIVINHKGRVFEIGRRVPATGGGGGGGGGGGS